MVCERVACTHLYPVIGHLGTFRTAAHAGQVTSVVNGQTGDDVRVGVVIDVVEVVVRAHDIYQVKVTYWYITCSCKL